MRTTTCLLLILASGCYQGLDLDDTGDTGTTGGDGGDGSSGEETGAHPHDEELGTCEPGVLYACYEGPPGTRDVGLCTGGQRRCGPSGSGLGACEGMVVPVAERCDTPDDDDCDGSSACGGLEHIYVHNGALLHDLASTSDRVVLAWSDEVGAHLTLLSTNSGTERTLDLGTGLALGDRLLLAFDEATRTITLGATLAGTFGPALDRPDDCSVSAGAGDILIAQFADDLTLISSRCWGDAANQRLTALDLPADGQPRIAGVFNGTLEFADATLEAPDEHTLFFAQLAANLDEAVWTDAFYATSNALELPGIAASDGGAVALGTQRGGAGSSGGSDVFVTHYAADGTRRWTQTFGNEKDQVGRDIAVGGGTVWISGESQGLLDLGDGPSANLTTFQTFVARLDPATGDPLAAQQLAGVSSTLTQGRALAVDSMGDATLIGAASGPLLLAGQALPGDDGTDVVLLKLGPSGAFRWAKRLGDQLEQTARSVHLDTREHILLGGEFTGSIGDGAISVHSATSQLFALKFMP